MENIISEAQAQQKIIESLGRFSQEAESDNIKGLVMAAVTNNGKCILVNECSLLTNSLEMSVLLGRLFVQLNSEDFRA